MAAALLMMSGLNHIIHQPVRLRIMAALCQLRPRSRVDFGFLRDRLDLTDGNLGAHLLTLEEAGYIIVEKSFVGRRPKTYVQVAAKGRAAFASHVAALDDILKSSA